MTTELAFVASSARWRLALMFALSLGFVALGASLAGAFGTDHPTGWKPLVAGWLGIVFFGPCAVVIGASIPTAGPVLRIDARGVGFKPWSGATIAWDDVVGIRDFAFASQRMIGLVLRDPTAYPSNRLLGRLKSANRGLTGVDAIWLTVNGTDRSFDDLDTAIARFAPRRIPRN